MIEHINVTQAAKVLGVSRQTMYSMLDKKQIPHTCIVRLPTGSLRFRADRLERWLDDLADAEEGLVAR